MISGLFAILLLLVFLVMTTLGSVLLAAFFIPKSTRKRRVFAAAFGGPAAFLVPIMAFAALDSLADMIPVLIGFGVLGGIMIAAVGWPVAHFATKRLDRLIQFDLETFE